MRTRNWIFLIIFFLLLASCNLPVANEPPATESPAAPAADAIGTAVELTTVAKLTELAPPAVVKATDAPASAPTETPSPTPGSTPSPTPCTALVTASTVANIRSGPGTAYDVVGSLPLGGTAPVAGRNDANTWWYIEFSGGAGGHAWIAGSVVTASCLPSVVQVIAGPPLPTSEPTATEDISLPPPVAGVPDLVANGMQFAPVPGKKDETGYIQVSVKNTGSAPAGSFTVAWLSNQDFPGCDWTVSGLGVGATKNLSCTFTYTTAQYPAASNTFWVALVVDSGNQVDESNEGNNSRDGQWTVTR